MLEWFIARIIAVVLSAVTVWMLWDDCMIPLFKLPDITFFRALALCLIIDCLFNIPRFPEKTK